jgi:hypothetical protein
VKIAIFKKYGFIFGCNEKPSEIDCGKIIGKVMCSSNNKHPSYYKHMRCDDPLCPVCHVKYTSRIAKAVVERVRGYRSVYGYDPISHLIFWPDSLTGYSNITDAFRNASVLLKKMNVKMAVVWYHPYRIPDEIKEQLRRYKHVNGLSQSIGFWKLAHDDVLGLGCLDAYIVPGPHFHTIVSGYLLNILEYSKLGIGGYKKVRRLDSEKDLETVANYISTHSCCEKRKSTVRYYGMISYSKLSRDDGIKTVEDVECEICQKHLKEYYASESNGKIELNGIKHDHITRVVMVYTYWKRGDRPKQTRQEMIWGGAVVNYIRK